MSSYAVAIGHNNAAGLDAFDFQPKQPKGIEYPEQVYGGDLSSSFLGNANFTLLWTNTMERGGPDTLLAQCGLNNNYGSEVTSNEVTIRILDNDDQWIVVNATVYTPRQTSRHFVGWSGFEINGVIEGLSDAPEEPEP